MLDCLVIGAGPAGLNAALYLARFKRHFKIIDSGHSRALLIPKTHTLLGFEKGISGIDLLNTFKKHLLKYQINITHGNVTKITKQHNGTFLIKTSRTCYQARNVILATGVIDNIPPIPHQHYSIKQGLIRICPICDAYEVKNKKIGILGFKAKDIQEAIFLYNYSKDIYFFTLGKKLRWTPKIQETLKKTRIKIITDPVIKLSKLHKKVILTSKNNQNYQLEVLYSALGMIHQSQLALPLKVKHTTEKEIIVNHHQETNIKGLYAIGDVTKSLNQITVAMSQGAIAATAIQNKFLSV